MDSSVRRNAVSFIGTLLLCAPLLLSSCSDKKPAGPEPKPPIETWSKIYNDIVGESSVIIESDNGYLFTGVTGYMNPGDFLFAEIDADGNLLWWSDYGTYGDDYAFDVVRTQEGYIAVGTRDPTLTLTYRLGLVAVDKTGNLLWEKEYLCGYKLLWMRSIVEAGDGGFVVAGSADPMPGDPEQGLDAYVMKVSAKGDSIWALRVDWGDPNTVPRSICRTTFGNFAIAGDTWTDACFMRVDTSGHLMDDVKKYSGFSETSFTIASDLVTVPDGYLIVGLSENDTRGDLDFVLWKLDHDGTLQWKHTYDYGQKDDFAMRGAFVGDGYVVVGVITPDDEVAYKDTYMFKTDLDGNELWRRTYGMAAGDWATGVMESPDGGLIMVGVSRPDGSATVCRVIKTDDEGNLSPEDSL